MQNGYLNNILLTFLLLGTIAQSATSQTVYVSSDIPLTIASSSAVTVTSTITITGGECITDINVIDFGITHTWINDLTATLTSPQGTTISLFNQICSGEDDFDINFDDSGTAYGSIPCPPTDGNDYHPEGDLASFVGENSNGTWTLSVTDNFTWDGGSFDSWSLEIESESCFQPSGACDPNTPFFAADLSGDPAETYISPSEQRDGDCCNNASSTPTPKCIEFDVYLHPDAVGIEFDIYSGAVPSGAMFYQIDCGVETPVGDPICLTGQGPFTVTFCKPGNNHNEYSIQSIPSPVTTTGGTTYEGCPITLGVTGFDTSSIVWTDITSGTGDYQDELSCTTGCENPIFEIDNSNVSTIQYLVCGDLAGATCGASVINTCDTVTVDIVQAFDILVNPYPVIFCNGASSIPEVFASTTTSGDFDFTWYDADNGGGNLVSDTSYFTPTIAGDYSVVVYETNFGVCTEQIFNIDVQIIDCAEDCDNGSDDDYDGLVDAFDDDCPCEEGNVLATCDPTCEYIPPTLPNFSIEQEWSSNIDVNTLMPIVGGEMDGDLSSIELIALGELTGASLYEGVSNYIMVVDGGTGELKYRPNTLPISQNNKGIALADTDRDGNAEFYYVVSNDHPSHARKIACYEFNPYGTNPEGSGTGTFDLRWVSDNQVDCGVNPNQSIVQDFSVAVADFDFDGSPEVYVGNEIYDAATGQRVADGGTNSIGSFIYAYTHFHYHANPVAVDVLPDYLCNDCSGLELVAGNQVYSVDVASGTMTVVRQVENNLPDGMTSIVDYDLDGDLDGVVTTTEVDGSYLYIWDLQSNSQIGAKHTITEVLNPWYRSVSNAVIADFDGDNLPEIGVCANYVFQVIDDHTNDISGTGGVLWSITTTDNSGMTGAAAFDFNGDGITEVVYRDEDDLRIISGPTGLNLATYPCGSVTGTEYPMVADIDYDGETELVCNCGENTYSGTGTMQAFKSDTYPWVPTRSVWNQYAYFITNINDDLTIPTEQQQHQNVGTPPLGVSGRMNSFLKQVGPTNDLGDPVYPAANLEIAILNNSPINDCSALDSVEITIEMSNSGDLTFPGGTSFAAYDGNPEVAATLVSVYETEQNISPGDTITQSIWIPLSSISFPASIYIVGNDDGSLPIPFSLANDFPITTIGECDFVNNLDVITFDYCELTNDTEPPVITLTDATPVVTGSYPAGQTYFEFENGTWAMADVASNIDNGWTTVNFPASFNSPPAVFAQVVTQNNAGSVFTRIRNVSETSFQIKLQRQDSHSGGIPDESVAWIAMELGGSSANETMEVMQTGEDVDENWYEISFNETFTNTPLFIGNLTTYESGDPVHPRFRNLTSSTVEVIAHEDQSSDTELNHSNEQFSYAAFNDPGEILDRYNAAFAEVGSVLITHDNSESDWVTVTTTKTYVNPVVVAGPVSYNDDDPAVARVRNANGNSFQIRLDELDYLNQTHSTAETIYYMVMESKPDDLVEPVVVNVTCSTIPTAPTATATDNCDNQVDIIFEEDISPTSCGNTITRTWTATDNCGNQDVEVQVIDLTDNTPPSIANIPADLTLSCGDDIPVAEAFECSFVYENIALNKTVTQSSTGYGGNASRAIDGNTDGAWGNNSVTHTGNDANAWLELDLGAIYQIDSIELWGRTDCCSDRLSDYYILVSENPFTSSDLATTLGQSGVTNFYFNTAAGAPATVNLNATARYVRVQLNETNNLSIAELKVFSPKADGICASDDCDTALDLDYQETSTQTSDGSCTDQNYVITRTWTATDDCGNVTTETQTISLLCECCNNGIDDDGDGLPDHADPDCNCAEPDLTSCDSLIYYYVPPVWQLNGNSYNNDPGLIITTLFSEANVSIMTADGTTFNQSFTVSNGNPETVSLSTDELQTPNNNTVETDRGFIIESDHELSILYRMDAYNNQFLAKIKGEEALGYSFRAGSQTKTCGSPSTSRRENHFVSVIATEDNTTVTFDFSTVMAGGISSPHAVVLDRGETYIITDNNTNVTISGTLVTGDKPISVMSGSQHTNICNSFLGDSGLDHLVPICNIGTEYAVIRGDGSDHQNYALIVATEDNTEVYLDGTATVIATIDAGEYYEHDLPGSLGDPYYISTSKPAYLYQFSGMSTVNPEVDMTLVPPVTGCNGERQVGFARFDGADIQQVQIIASDAALATLTFNGAPYTDYAVDVPITGLPGYSAISLEDGLIDVYNTIEADAGFFHVGLLTGISNTSGTFSYITGFKDNVDIYDPDENLPTSYYFVDSICVGTTYSHCITVASCTNNNNIVSISNDASFATINQTSDLCFDYIPETNSIGTDVITVVVQNEYGQRESVCLEFYVCNGVEQLTVVNIPAVITVDCSEEIAIPVVPITSEGCVEVEYTENLTSGSGGCADNSYTLERRWVARGFCGNDSLEVLQSVVVIDTTPPTIFNVPENVDLQCQDCLQSFLNGDFEEPGFSGSWSSIHEDDISGWSTTASDNRIEVQKSGFIGGVVSYTGNYHAELNGNLNGDLYQEFCTVPTTTLQVSFAHRKRPSGINSTDDIMAVYAGPAIDDLEYIGVYSADDNSGWTVHTFSYFIPPGQDNTVIAFRAIQGAPSNLTYGNLLDDINVITLFDNVLVPDAFDNCDNDVELILSEETVTGDCDNHFQLIRTWTAVDNCGNVSEASQVLSVGDFSPPVFTNIPADLTVYCDDIPEMPTNIIGVDSCTASSEIVIVPTEVAGNTGCNYQIIRTWSATDACGNTGDSSQIITVIDDVEPQIISQPANLTVYCGQDLPPVIEPVVVDDCTSALNVTYDSTTTNTGCIGEYQIQRRWTYLDDCFNEAIVTQLIFVRDTTAPVFTTFPDDLTFACNEAVVIPEPVATDACGGTATVTFADNSNSSNCANNSSFTRTWTATDPCGNQTTHDQLISIIDNTPPTFSFVPNDTTVLCHELPYIIEPVASDDCGTVSISLEELKQSESCEDAYEVVRTWTATDDCGNESFAVQVITVIDTIRPIVVVSSPDDVTINCEDGFPAIVDPEFGDNCDNEITVDYEETFTDGCFDDYIMTRTWTATDNCGNFTVETQTITLIDIEAPTLTVTPIDVTVECDNIPAFTDVAATDNCDANLEINYTLDSIPGTCPNAYVLQRNWTITDDCGNVTTGSQSITVQDSTPPTIADVPDDITVDCGDVPSPVTLTASDACDANVSVVYNEARTDGNCGDGYILTRTWTSEDVCGNENIETQIITVQDAIDPVLSGVPNDTTVNCGEIPDAATVTATDNCATGLVPVFEEIRTDGSCPSDYILTRTWTIEDNCGNETIGTQVITVQDILAPVFSTTPDDVTLDCGEIPAEPTITVSDNCDPTVTVQFNEDSVDGSCPGESIIIRTWTSTDACGNTTSETQTITVEDSTLPTFDNAPIDVTVECGTLPDPATITASDNCGGTVDVTYVDTPINGTNIVSHNSGSLNEIIGTSAEYFPVILSGYDNLTASDIQDLYVFFRTRRGKGDAEIILIAPSGDAIVLVGEHCNTGNCLDADNGFEKYEATFFHCGTGYDQWNNVDPIPEGLGNFEPHAGSLSGFSGVTQFVSCFDELTGPMNGTWNVAALAADSDPLTLNRFTIRVNDSSCLDQAGVTRVFTATDECGNTAIYTQTISIEDTTGPSFDTTPGSLADINCDDVFPVQETLTASDCSGAVIVDATIDPYTVDFCAGYEVTYRWVAEDNCGNTSEITQTFDVLPDNGAPVFASVPNDTIVNCGEIPAIPTLSAADDCAGGVDISFEEIRTDGSCPNSYTLTRTWTAEDLCGNQTPAIQVITVQDLIDPVLSGIPDDLTVSCDENISVPTVTATDNCTLDIEVEFSETRTDGVCSESYTLTRTWTAVDSCNNNVVATQIITVQDVIAPVLINVPADTIVNCGEIPDTAIVTATDLCGTDPILTFEETQTNGGCPGEYILTRIWTATDSCGNQTQELQTISIQDTIAPVFVFTPNDTIVDCNTIPAPLTLSATDNCGSDVIIAYNEDSFAGDCVDFYNIIRTWTATDACGNIDSTVQVVTVTGCGPGIQVNAAPDSTLCDGGEITLTVTMTTGYTTPNFLWQFSPNGTDWTDIPGSNNEINTFTVDPTTQGYYHVIVANSPTNFNNPSCSVISNDIYITVLSSSPDTDLVEVICQGESYPIGTEIFNSTGNYSVTLQNENGCDSIVNLDLTVNPVYTVDLDETICEGESYPVGGNNYTTTGNYTDILTSVDGCDSTVNLTLTVNPIYTIDTIATICQGESVSVGTSIYSTAGTYSDLLVTSEGCDSTVNLTLIVNPIYTIDSVAVICQGESVTIGSNTYTTSGTYSDLLTTVNGCDSTINLDLTVNPVYTVDLDETICEGESYPVGGNNYTTTGNYTDILTSVDGCDSTVNLTLTVNPIYTIDTIATICQGESVSVGTSIYSTAGTYSDQLMTAEGCDSTVNLTLIVNPIYTIDSVAVICQGESVTIGSNTYTTSGNYSDLLTTVNGCDSTINLDLTVNPVYTVDLDETICEGESYPVGGNNYTTTGNYTDILTSVDGCDSTVNLTLTVNPIYTIDTIATICQGESVSVGTSIYSTAGTYSDQLMTAEGCDSTVNLTLIVNPNYTIDSVAVICQGESVTIGSNTYTTSGTYSDLLTTVNGCDSTINLDLTVNPVYTVDLDETICEGESYPVGGNNYTTTGNYTDILTSVDGCDSTVNLTLTVNPVYAIDSTATICQGESITIGGNTYTTTGNYTDQLTTINGCDSIINLTLVVNQPTDSEMDVNLCEGDTHQGTVYNASIILIDNYTNANGCDSTVTTNIIVHPHYDELVEVSTCEGGQHEGIAYFQDTIFTQNLTSVFGCDSIVTTQISVTPEINFPVDVELCYGETYNGTAYTSGASFQNTYSATGGCDSIVTTTITVLDEIIINIDSTICEGESVTVGSNIYTTSGTTQDVLTSSAGCDSTINLTLTVNEVFMTNLDETICQGDSLVVGNNTYLATGNYTDTLPSVTGCDSIINTLLVVNPTYSIDIDRAICEGESVAIGTSNYAVAGNYTDVLMTTNGCDSTVNLTLTVNPVYTIDSTATICQGESITIGGNTYTTSGNYTDILSTVNNCDSTINLTLIVNPPTSSTTDVDLCEGGTYDGVVYNASTTLTNNYLNANGCDSTETINIIVHPAYAETVEVQLCDGGTHNGVVYNADDVIVENLTSEFGCDSIVTIEISVIPEIQVEINQELCYGATFEGTAYTADASFSNTYVSVGGCDSIVTTNITVVDEIITNLDLSICEGESVEVGGNTYSTSGTTQDVLTSAAGCDSIVNLILTVNDVFTVGNPQTICQGGSITVGTNTYTASGSYIDTVQTTSGCDSIINTFLVVNPTYSIDIDRTICEGESVAIGTSNYTVAGNYTDVLMTANGCDSTVNLNLTVNPVYTIDSTATICQGESITIGGNTYTSAGNYTDVLSTVNNCDSTINLTLIVNPPTSSTTDVDLCEGGTYDGVVYNASTTLTNNYLNANGCDSTETINIIVHPAYAETVEVQLCDGGMYNGVVYTADEVIVENLTSEFGCDSIVTTEISVIPEIQVEINQELCYGATFEGTAYTADASFSNTYVSVGGCDSIVTTNITVVDEIITNLDLSICEGESVEVGGNTYSTSGTTQDVLTSAAGCDSIVNLILTVNDVFTVGNPQTICQGGSITVGTNTYTASGNYIDTVQTTSGCDSIINTFLVVNPTYSIDVDRTICEGESVAIGTSNYTVAGNYTDVLMTTNGCDSTVNLTLTVNPVYTIDSTATICQGESITIGGNTYTTSGNYTDILSTVNNCDSTINLTLIVNPPTSSTADVELCEGEMYDGVIYTTSSTLTDTYTNVNGCDSIVTTNIIVFPVFAETIEVEICEGGAYDGIVYNTNDVVVNNLQTVNGCDSIVTVEITVIPEITTSLDVDLCYGESYNGVTYTADETLVSSHVSVGGCDSISTVNITVTDQLITNLDLTICNDETVTVGGNIYNTSGTTQDILTSSTGCDSIVNLTLTVHETYTESLTEVICQGQSISVGTNVYASTGNYIDTLQTINGCDSIINLDLTVNPTYSIGYDQTICEGGSITVGANTYSTTGVYRDTLPTINGCDSILILNLVVNPILTTDDTVEICEGESHTVGTSVYNTSGTYQDVLTTTSGCDSIVNLTLIVHQPSSSASEVELCSGEDHDGMIYTSSTILLDTIQNFNGCDSVITTNVIVHPAYSDTTNISICEGMDYNGIFYASDTTLVENGNSIFGCDSTHTTIILVTPDIQDTIQVNLCYGEAHLGNTYTASTILTDDYIAQGGCDSIVTTIITVREELVSNENEEICEGESVTVGTSIYTTTGSYTDILQSVTGCDSTVNLNLLVHQPTTSSNNVELCSGEDHNGVVYSSNATLLDTLVNANGCDSVITTNVIVYPVYSDSTIVTVCEGAPYQGIVYPADTVLVDLQSSINGCDSITSIVIDVIPLIYDTVNVSLCYGSTYDGVVYNMNESYTNTFSAVSGCDSIVTTNIFVADELITNLNEQICEGDSVVVGSSVHTSTGSYSDLLIASDGCDSIVNLILTVHPNHITNLNETICEGETFPVGDFDFGTAGPHAVILSSIYGCDSTVNLNLTVNPVYLDTIYETICEGGSVTVGMTDYSTTGLHTTMMTTESGCDSTVVLDLTVNPVYDLTFDEQVCEGESYELDGVSYSTTGTYSATLQSVTGCDSMVTINLTAIPIYTSTIYANICDGESYLAGGALQTVSGTYYDTLINSAGCPSVLITQLLVLDVYENVQSVSICYGESIFAGGGMQNTSGTYSDTLSTTYGCDSLVTTFLTVLPTYLDTIDINICDGETYSAGGAEQDSDGTYINNYETTQGCDSIQVINLTVSPIQLLTLPITMCEGETITVNGVDYGESGIYIDSLNSTAGCDSLVTYNVTVIERYETLFNEVICEGDSVFIAGEFRLENGEFTETFTSATGCDSLVITELTVEPSAQLAGEDAVICFGEEVQLLVTGSEFVQWFPSEGLSCDDCPNPIADPRVTTTYTVSTESCLGTMTEIYITVEVNNPPSLTLTDNTNVLLNNNIVLEAFSSDPDALITWYQNGEVICEDCVTLTAEPSGNLSYFVMVEDEFGCTNSNEINVNVNDACSFSNFEIPNIISPNNDGYNDEFEIKYEGVEEVSILRIYNRWGELVFETNDLSQRWDGTFRGQKLNPGVYIYYLEGLCLDNEPFTKTGNVTILR